MDRQAMARFVAVGLSVTEGDVLYHTPAGYWFTGGAVGYVRVGDIPAWDGARFTPQPTREPPAEINPTPGGDMHSNRDNMGNTVMDDLTIALDGIQRLANSANGNPRHRVVFTDGHVYDTEPDAQVNHLITNSEYQGVPLRVTLNPRGRIIGVEPPQAAR